MSSPHLSPARLTQTARIDVFLQFLCEHGALGYGFDPKRATTPPSEEELLAILPLFFGLMPLRALVPPVRSGYPAIRPLISSRLEKLSLQEQLLEDVLVSIADQYRSTQKNRYLNTNSTKFGMRDVRARRSMYGKIQQRQGNRCATCGAPFHEVDETLDHIVPWQFIGDISDGSNWQVMCQPCNSGKGDLVSSLQSPFAHDWLYGGTFTWPSVKLHQVSRYLALRRSVICAADNCKLAARDTRLFVVRKDLDAVPSLDNLDVRCDDHVGAEVNKF
jgi:5-methylcytosine-specific restriction endonuclease McrA